MLIVSLKQNQEDLCFTCLESRPHIKRYLINKKNILQILIGDKENIYICGYCTNFIKTHKLNSSTLRIITKHLSKFPDKNIILRVASGGSYGLTRLANLYAHVGHSNNIAENIRRIEILSFIERYF